MSVRIARASGSPAPASASAFLPDPAVSLRPPSAANLRLRFHPPASFPPPAELRQTACPSRFRSKSASLGVPLPHRDLSLRRPPPPGDPPPGFVPSSAFLTPSTACSATCLCGLVSSRSHVQGLPSRGLSLSAEPYRLSPADSCPRAVQTPAPLTSACALGFRAFTPRGECGVDQRRLELRPIRAPPGLPPPPGSPSPHGESAFTPSPHATFAPASPPELVHCVSSMRGSVFLEPGHRPARGSWPEPSSSFRR